MSLIPVLLTPLVALLPVATAIDRSAAVADAPITAAPAVDAAPAELRRADQGAAASQGAVLDAIAESYRSETQFQVRIEQQTTIRITPLHTPMPVRRSMLSDLSEREQRGRMVERNIGRCLRAATISGVQPDTRANRLLLFMRDRRVVTAQLERSCRARDFYSGFYLARSTDGRMCVDRDVLLSRSGANCRITRMRQLVQSDD